MRSNNKGQEKDYSLHYKMTHGVTQCEITLLKVGHRYCSEIATQL